MIRIIATSDMHGKLPEIDECDLLLIVGDICPEATPEDQSVWLNTVFRSWLEKTPAKEIVGVAGNHDYAFAEGLVPKDLKWHFLQDSMIELFGFKIYGMPWQLPFQGVYNLEEAELKKKYQKIPKGVDILLSHGPPFGYGDELQIYKDRKPDKSIPLRHVGTTSLLKALFEIKPKLFLCGHIHRSFGIYVVDGLTLANVAHLDDLWEVANKPFVFYL